MDRRSIRNFVIISHIDHGKSTLADRFLELTSTVDPRKMRPQYLDQMELEREKGITIKMQPVRMLWRPSSMNNESGTNKRIRKFETDLPFADEYILNLIDTPGHADFSYEVSRALAAVEGAILLVDGTQGIQAQTVANFELARKERLVILPVINKIDLESCRIEEVREEIQSLFACRAEDVFLISAKAGTGVRELLGELAEKIPAPGGEIKAPLRALAFDSQFDAYKGVIAHIRVFDGELRPGDKLRLAKSGAEFEALEVGTFRPAMERKEALLAGEIGYVASGLKDFNQIRVGDTITKLEISPPSAEPGPGQGNSKLEIGPVDPLPGYEEPRPVVFASVYPEKSGDYEIFRQALSKLKLNDASLSFEPESSPALGRGFRIGFLGLLHLEIVGERLKREYGLKLTFTAPAVSYKVRLKGGEEHIVHSAAKFPDDERVVEIQEPWVRLNVISTDKYLGAVMRLIREVRGRHLKSVHLSPSRAEVIGEAPLGEVVLDFYDRLKSVSQGYSSLSYAWLGYRPAKLVKLDILVAQERRSELSVIVPAERAYGEGRRLCARLKAVLPRALFPVAIQASVGGRVIARETLPALRKDVTGYLYGGDRTRKMKLWARQKRGKERLKTAGRFQIPADLFLKLLRGGPSSQP